MKSKVIKRRLKDITPEEIEKIRVNRIKRNKEQTLESQLGYFVGEHIVHKDLPTLSTDLILSRNVIQVSEDDIEENKKLEVEWYHSISNGCDENHENGSKKKWEKYYNHHKMLEKKYLPEKLVCYIKPLNVGNIDEFKNGLITSLWNCDMCAYSLKPENIKIYDTHHGDFTVIEFIRGVDE